jgi:hypothetical protein
VNGKVNSRQQTADSKDNPDYADYTDSKNSKNSKQQTANIEQPRNYPE